MSNTITITQWHQLGFILDRWETYLQIAPSSREFRQAGRRVYVRGKVSWPAVEDDFTIGVYSTEQEAQIAITKLRLLMQ